MSAVDLKQIAWRGEQIEAIRNYYLFVNGNEGLEFYLKLLDSLSDAKLISERDRWKQNYDQKAAQP